MEEHPNGEPCSAKAVDGRYNDDCEPDEQFERKRIYDAYLEHLNDDVGMLNGGRKGVK